MIKYAVFDLDGTLLNTIKTITHYVNSVLRCENIREISEEECKYFVGDGARALIRRALASRGNFSESTFLRVYEDYNREYNGNALYLTEPYEGIPELLSELKKRSITLAVLSNKPDYATREVIGSFFPNTFSAVRGGIDGVPLKPEPDGVFEILRELGADISEVIYLGDTGVDMQTGKGAGAKKTVGVLWGFRTREELLQNGADAIVESPLDILNLLDN